MVIRMSVLDSIKNAEAEALQKKQAAAADGDLLIDSAEAAAQAEASAIIDSAASAAEKVISSAAAKARVDADEYISESAAKDAAQAELAKKNLPAAVKSIIDGIRG